MRIPVQNPDSTPAMPTKPSRARRWIRDGKAIGKWSDLKIYYVQLIIEPSNKNIQPIAIGIGRGYTWVGKVIVTTSIFRVIRRLPICRRQLHLMVPAKGGIRRKYGGSTTRHGFRKGDLVNSPKGIGYVSGDTEKQVSVSDSSWKRLGQIVANKINLIRHSNGLIVV